MFLFAPHSDCDCMSRRESSEGERRIDWNSQPDHQLHNLQPDRPQSSPIASECEFKECRLCCGHDTFHNPLKKCFSLEQHWPTSMQMNCFPPVTNYCLRRDEIVFSPRGVGRRVTVFWTRWNAGVWSKEAWTYNCVSDWSAQIGSVLDLALTCKQFVHVDCRLITSSPQYNWDLSVEWCDVHLSHPHPSHTITVCSN